MKTFCLALFTVSAHAFVGSGIIHSTDARANAVCMAKRGYVPSGMTAEQWKKIKEKEASEKAERLGAVGVNRFRSRSMWAFMKDLEDGKAAHLMPVDPNDVRSGKIKLEDVPYMQRGGSWDGSDLKGVKKQKWSRFDEKFEREERGGSGSDEAWFSSLPWNNGPEQKASKAKQEFFGKVGRGGAAEREAAKKAAAKQGRRNPMKPQGSIYTRQTRNTEYEDQVAANAAQKKGPFGLW